MNALARAFVLSAGDIARCPKHSLSPRHYHDDRTCKCAELPAAEQEVADARAAFDAARDRLRTAQENVRNC